MTFLVSFLAILWFFVALNDDLCSNDVLEEIKLRWQMRWNNNWVTTIKSIAIVLILLTNLMSSLLGVNIFTLVAFNLSIGENMMLLRSATILPVFWKIWSGCKFLAELPCCIAAGPDSSTKETNHKTRYKSSCYRQLLPLAISYWFFLFILPTIDNMHHDRRWPCIWWRTGVISRMWLFLHIFNW